METEKALDMLPHAVDIFEKLDVMAQGKKIAAKYKGKKKVDPLEVGIQVTAFILKNAPKVKTEILSIVAIAEDKTIEEVKKQSLVKTFTTFKSLVRDPELLDFFKSAMQ